MNPERVAALRALVRLAPDDWPDLAEALALTPYVGHGRPGVAVPYTRVNRGPQEET